MGKRQGKRKEERMSIYVTHAHAQYKWNMHIHTQGTCSKVVSKRAWGQINEVVC